MPLCSSLVLAFFVTTKLPGFVWSGKTGTLSSLKWLCFHISALIWLFICCEINWTANESHWLMNADKHVWNPMTQIPRDIIALISSCTVGCRMQITFPPLFFPQCPFQIIFTSPSLTFSPPFKCECQSRCALLKDWRISTGLKALPKHLKITKRILILILLFHMLSL